MCVRSESQRGHVLMQYRFWCLNLNPVPPLSSPGMYLYVASAAMLINGLVYCGLGVCMLTPLRAVGKRHHTHWNLVGGWYPSMFKNYLTLLQPGQSHEMGADDATCVLSEGSDDVVTPIEQFASQDLAFRLLAYVILLLGFWRILTAMFWVCGFVFLGLGSCVAEIGIISLELLRHDSVLLHRTMLVLFLDVLLILIYSVPAFSFCL